MWSAWRRLMSNITRGSCPYRTALDVNSLKHATRGGPLPEPQNYKNHQQRAVGFLVGSGLLAINLVWAFYRLIQSLNGDTIVGLLTAIALIVLAFSLRTQVLTVQDRVIRTEMRLRLARVLGHDQTSQIERLTARQLVALRFAADHELPALVGEVLAGSLKDGKAIKMRVKDWQADYLRA